MYATGPHALKTRTFSGASQKVSIGCASTISWIKPSIKDIKEGYCSDFPQGEFGSQKSKTPGKGMQTLSDPGSEEAGQSHADGTTLRATRATAHFARNDQKTPTTLGQVVVGGHTWISHTPGVQTKTLDPFAPGMHERLGLNKRRTHLPQLLLEGVLKRHLLRVPVLGGNCGSGVKAALACS